MSPTGCVSTKTYRTFGVQATSEFFPALFAISSRRSDILTSGERAEWTENDKSTYIYVLQLQYWIKHYVGIYVRICVQRRSDLEGGKGPGVPII